jgi:hypothetical protein
VELPDGLIDSSDACDAVSRGATRQKLWPLMTLGKGTAKALVSAIRLDGAPIKEEDTAGWRHTAAVVANGVRQREVKARWEVFAKEIGGPTAGNAKAAVDLAGTLLQISDDARGKATLLASLVANAFSIETLAHDPALCRAVAEQIRAAATSMRLAAAEQDRRRVLHLFRGDDPTSDLARQFIDKFLGKPSAASVKVTSIWDGLLSRLTHLKTLASSFETIIGVTRSIEAAGAPEWARMLQVEQASPDDRRTSSAWRDAWDHAAADAHLARIDAREKLLKLATERETAEKRCRQLFGEIVRERTFYQLDRRLSDAIKAALVEFVHALTKIGKGTGKTAWMHRRTARGAMAKCYGAVPCWIMPTWRVAEQLPCRARRLRTRHY